MEQVPPLLPVLPIRNAVLFPTISMPLMVGRPRSLKAVELAEGSHHLVVVVAQRLLTTGDPHESDLYRVGTLCKIESSSSTDNGGRQVVVTGIARFRVAEFLDAIPGEAGYLQARGETVSDTYVPDNFRSQALLNNLKSMAREILELLPGATEPLIRLIDRVDDASYLTNVCAAYLNLTLSQKQGLLETIEAEKRMDNLLSYMQREREVLNLQREIRDKMSERLSKAQRDALLREQLRTIRTELGEENSDDAGDEIEEKIDRAGLPAEAAKQAREELKRLRALPQASAEYHVIRSYLEWLAALPWKRSTQDQIDLSHARKVLDEDHHGLESVKRRILQFLAVAKLKNDLHGPILCLVGPPGVGKTSLGQSIARTVGRNFIRTSLGGVRDEAEVRGHRRTYVGAMPGRIIQSIKRVGSRNPVMVLDEIDKLRADFHGDPSAAMLEVLDPEQNSTFTDHYLDVPFDLSDVFFVCTANVLDNIPPALRDRMEIIEVNGYTSIEKLQIARNHLLGREIKAHGFKPDQVLVPDETLLRIIHHHTREAGVRELSRKIAGLLRAAAEQVVGKGDLNARIAISPERLADYLGPERFSSETIDHHIKPGVATGLAWTPHGGDILYIEATRMPGRGKLLLTGQLGDVMKESAQIAVSLARSNPILHAQNFDFSKHDLHIHVPGGAIPKDGPSAGVTLLMALISLLTGKTLDPTLGMTGEITLRGTVLPVGGIKEKVLAAHRAELRTLLLPKRNELDLRDVPPEIREQMRFHFVDSVDEVARIAFGRIDEGNFQGSQDTAA